MARKTVVVVMNCQGREIIRYLRSSPSLSCQYDFLYVSNIVLGDDEAAKRRTLLALSTASVVISQNVSSVAWLQNDVIAAHIPKGCRFFRLCFWRFYGYWPIAAAKFHPQMWYVGDEIPTATDVRTYLRADVPPARIVRNFEEQIDRFEIIEKNSDLKMLPFVLENYRNWKIFSDEWHPTSLFFHHVACRIMTELGFTIDIALLPDDGVDNFRHRLVLDAVASELGLGYDQSLIKYYDVETDRETFFAYCKFAERHYDRTVTWTDPDGSFREWCFVRRIDDAPCEVSRLGRIDAPPEPQRRGGLLSRLASGRGAPAVARAADRPDIRWSIDLRDLRQIRSMDIRLDGDGRGAAMAVLSSTDGRDWRKLTVVHDPPRSPTEPLTLAFREPVLSRYVRLDACGPSDVRVVAVEIYTRAVSLASAG